MTPEEKFHRLFSGFQLVEVAQIPEAPDWSTKARGGDFSEISISKVTEAQHLAPGNVYIFRKVDSTNEVVEGSTILPHRLREIGATVDSYPASSNEMTTTFFGGPLFLIEFHLDGHKGSAFNYVRQDPAGGLADLGLVVSYH
ncbi:MAG: hypothetical protein WBQ94_17530 [Terracidiphilus sp.]